MSSSDKVLLLVTKKFASIVYLDLIISCKLIGTPIAAGKYLCYNQYFISVLHTYFLMGASTPEKSITTFGKRSPFISIMTSSSLNPLSSSEVNRISSAPVFSVKSKTNEYRRFDNFVLPQYLIMNQINNFKFQMSNYKYINRIFR